MRYVMLLSFMLELLSRHRHSLLMKGIAWLGGWLSACVCVSMCVRVCVFASVNNSLPYLCVHACVGSECTVMCVSLSAHVCVSEWEEIVGIPVHLTWGAWQHGHPRPWNVRVCLPWRPYNGLSQCVRITHLCQLTYVTCYVCSHWKAHKL